MIFVISLLILLSDEYSIDVAWIDALDLILVPFFDFWILNGMLFLFSENPNCISFVEILLIFEPHFDPILEACPARMVMLPPAWLAAPVPASNTIPPPFELSDEPALMLTAPPSPTFEFPASKKILPPGISL